MSQLLFSCDPCTFESIENEINSNLNFVPVWMNNNMLHINPRKTKAIYFVRVPNNHNL